jgi:hypothetical protein
VDEKYINAYTRWLRSPTTKLVIERAQAALMSEVHAIDDSTVVGAVQGHYFRKGGEVVLNFLTSQLTTDDLEKLRKQNVEADYDAEAKVNEDLFRNEEGI